MRKLLAIGLTGFFLVMAGCQGDSTTTGLDENLRPLAGPSFHEVGVERFFFDMNDRLAIEKGAGGSGQADVDDGTVEVEVEAEGLIPGDEYELNVTIDFASVETFGPVTADEDGEVEFEGDIELAPGMYRLDFFVTRPTGDVADIPGLFARDLLLACQPAVFLTIEADD